MHHIKPRRWIPIWGIGVVVTTAITAATMTGSCVFDTRTNFCEQFGLRCKEGQECAAHEAVCIDIGGCGNGVVDRDKGEICDDGNIEDGEIINGVFVPDSCSHDCMSNQTCGNNQIDVGETCDDGDRNGLPDDGCDKNCQLKAKFCGNGIVEINMLNMSLSEQCDPGDMDSAGCNSNQANILANLFNPDPTKPLDPDLEVGCKFSRCGDGYRNMAAGEQCDTRGQNTAECNGPLCTLPSCGDNFHNEAAEEDCDNGGADTPGCNGNKNGSNGPGNCKFPKCGDGYANTAFTPPGSTRAEACDTMVDSQFCNGNSSGSGSANNLDARCQVPQCGDGYVNSQFTPPNADHPEECDNGTDATTEKVLDTIGCNGNNNGSNGPGSCRIPSCGDGYTNSKFTPPGAHDTENCDNGVDPKTGEVDNTAGCNGNNNGSNGPGSCHTPSCGDGYTNTAFTPPGDLAKPEQCDTGVNTQVCNGNDNDNGLGDCQIPSCGDGYVNGAFTPKGSTQPEECDNIGGVDTPGVMGTPGCNGNNGGLNGPGSCRHSRCGDGYLNKPDGEQCDKGDSSKGIPAIPCSGTASCQPNCTCQ